MDFSQPHEYRTRLTSLEPTGLIPMILGLQDSHLYKMAWKTHILEMDKIKEHRRRGEGGDV